MKPLFTLFFILLFQLNTQAQNYLVEMVTNLSINNGSNPRWFTEYNNSLYFFANDGINGHKIFFIWSEKKSCIKSKRTGSH